MLLPNPLACSTIHRDDDKHAAYLPEEERHRYEEYYREAFTNEQRYANERINKDPKKGTKCSSNGQRKKEKQRGKSHAISLDSTT